MGTWASDTFGNDYARDWAQDLQETTSLEHIEGSIDNALDGADAELEAPFGAEALAAIDVLARLQGQPGAADDGTEDIDQWVARCKRKVTPALAAKAHAAIERVLSPQSELDQLWRESDEYEAWRAGVLALRARIVLTPP
ncbi:MAG TPA: hypothetical protein DCW29_20520 [Janthinobacterium sp.]|nr:hypothetical protein [Janthinobacterium sp.]